MRRERSLRNHFFITFAAIYPAKAPLRPTFQPGSIMRFVVIILVLLASLKVWTQDRMYRSVVGEALVEAYRDRAIEVCRKQTAKTVPVASQRTVAGLWSVASAAEITLGASDVNVALWDTENPLWQQRFRNPHLVLTGTGDSSAHCAYDLQAGVATLSP